MPVSDVGIEPDFIHQVVFVFESTLPTDFLPAVWKMKYLYFNNSIVV